MVQRQHMIVVGVIRNEKGEVLLGLRNQPEEPQEHDKWEFPGGGINFGEDLEEALKREIKEETGLEVKIIKLLPKAISNLWKYEDRIEQVIILPYECEIVRGEVKSGDKEVKELKFFKPSEIDYSKCLPKTKEIIELLNT